MGGLSRFSGHFFIAAALLLFGKSVAAAGGAAPVYTWSNAAIVGGGFVSGVIAHPLEKGLFYVRTDIGGAYRWDAAAGRWKSISQWIGADDWNYTGVESIAIDPSDANRVYIAAGTYTGRWARNGAMLCSGDRGESWSVTPLPFKNGANEEGRNNGERLAVDPHDGRILLFGSRRDGLWRSSDRGGTFRRVESFPKVPGEDAGQGITFILFDPQSGEPGRPTPVVYAGVSASEAGVYRSLDGGDSWQPVPHQPAGLRPHRVAVGSPHTFYFTYADAPGPNGIKDGAVWRLDGGDDRWTNITPEKPAGNRHFGYSAIAVDPHAPQTLVVSTLDRWNPGDELFRSSNGGSSWTALGASAQRDFSAVPWGLFGKTTAPNGPLGHWIAAAAIDPFDPDHLLYTTGWGMWESHDLTRADRGEATHWSTGAVGIEECVVNNVVSPPAGAPLLSVMWDLDGFRHEELQKVPSHFFEPAHGNNFGLDFAEKNPPILARTFGSGGGGAFSVNDGVTWTTFAGQLPTGNSGSIAVSAEGSRFVWSPARGSAALSSDRGRSWRVCAGLPTTVEVVSDRTDDRLFYGFDGRAGTIYRSSNGAVDFSAAATGLPRGKGILRAVPGQPKELWLATAEGLYQSKDEGAHFDHVSPSLRSVYKIGFGKTLGASAYPAIYLNGHFGDHYGLYRSDDEGGTWLEISDPHHLFGAINAITGDPRRAGRVYLASANFGIVYGDPAAPSASH